MTRSRMTHGTFSESSLRTFAKTCQGREGKGIRKGREGKCVVAVHHTVTAVTRERRVGVVKK